MTWSHRVINIGTRSACGCRVDSIRAKKGEDAEISASIKDRVNSTRPVALNVYVLHNKVIYKARITAKEVVEDILDGAQLACDNATLHCAKLPFRLVASLTWAHQLCLRQPA